MVVIGPVTLRNLTTTQKMLFIHFQMTNLCQLEFIENFIVTLSLIAVTGEDAVIVLNIKMFVPVMRDESIPDLSVTVLVGQTARLVMGTAVGGITGGGTTSETDWE